MFPGLAAEYTSLAVYLDRPRFANHKRQVPDAIRDEGTSIVRLEFAQTNDLLEDF